MTEKPLEYSFSLGPKGKTRYIAGPFDTETQKPHYEIEVSIPNHVRDQLEVKQILLGSPENCQLGWDIQNKTSCPAFITVKKDGILVKNT